MQTLSTLLQIERLEYNLHKIAANNKLLIEVLTDKTVLNKVQQNNFHNLFNDTQKLMLSTSIDFLTFKGRKKQLEKITVNPYINDVVKTVRKTLLELRKETKGKFNKKYIDYINTEFK
jgi:hypothetical protein